MQEPAVRLRRKSCSASRIYCSACAECPARQAGTTVRPRRESCPAGRIYREPEQVLAEPAELLIQRSAAERQRGRSSVRAMVRIIHEVPLAEKFLHLFGGEAMAGFDGSATGHRVEHVVQQIPASHLAVGLHQLFREVLDDLHQVAARNQRRVRHQQNRGAAELLNLEADLFQQVQ